MIRAVTWNTGVFLSWTLTSFLCHQFAKRYLQQSDSHLYDVIIVSACQLGLCYASLQVNSASSDAKERTKQIAAAGHVVATIATNYSLSYVHASSTLAIKVLEPISSAIIQWMIVSTPIPLPTIVSLPTIVAGAILFTGSPIGNTEMTFGLGLALISNLALAVRNIAMKVMFEDDQKLVTRSVPAMLFIQTLTASYIVTLYYFNVANALSIVFLFVSATAHVGYSYLSVALVLKSVSVVTHAVLNIFKRIFVVLLLCVFGTRVVTAFNLLGLILASLGLGVYVLGKIRSSTTTPANKPDIVKMNRRLIVCLLLCVAIVSLVMLKQRRGATSSITTGDASLDSPSALSIEEMEMLTLENSKKNKSPLDIPNERKIKWDNINVEPSFPDVDQPQHEEDYSQLKGPILGFPFETNKPVVAQNTIDEMIIETQNLQFHIFNELIGLQKYIILVDLATHENKGDSAIGVGEVLLIRRLKKEIIFYCDSGKCSKHALDDARKKAMKYGKNNVAVLCHGGGNIVSYPIHDDIRYRVFSIFTDFKIVVFPQSIWLPDRRRLEEGKRSYAMYPNVTMLMRDAQSLKRGQEHFTKNNLILCPDIAFQIGSVPRTMGPQYDIIWIKREDGESSKYSVSKLETHGLSIKIADWIKWMPSYGVQNTLEKINVASEMGFTFLMRGRVAITDRLHGHILSTMLHMPHVLLDTSDHKLTAYHNTWTKGLEGNTVLVAKTPQDAVDKARELLERFQNQLPKIASYMNLENGVA